MGWFDINCHAPPSSCSTTDATLILANIAQVQVVVSSARFFFNVSATYTENMPPPRKMKTLACLGNRKHSSIGEVCMYRGMDPFRRR